MGIPWGSFASLRLMVNEQTIVPTTAQKGPGTQERRSFWDGGLHHFTRKALQLCSSAGEGEGNLGGVGTERNANFLPTVVFIAVAAGWTVACSTNPACMSFDRNCSHSPPSKCRDSEFRDMRSCEECQRLDYSRYHVAPLI